MSLDVGSNVGHIICSESLLQYGEFRYTRDNSILTNEERQFYEKNGYIIIKKLVGDRIIDLCRDHFIDICNGVAPHDGMSLMREPTLLEAGATGENICYRLQHILQDEVFSQHTGSSKMLDYVESFTGPNITAIHSMVNNKLPDAPETTMHPLHQNLLYFPFRPADRLVGSWTAVQPVDTQNGCLVVLPGSHRRGELPHQSFQAGPHETLFGVKGLQNEALTPLLMDKGDTVFFHPLLIHSSGTNLTKGFPKALICHYASSICDVVDLNTTPFKDIAESIKANAIKGSEISNDFTTVMKLNSKCLRGKEGFTVD